MEGAGGLTKISLEYHIVEQGKRCPAVPYQIGVTI